MSYRVRFTTRTGATGYWNGTFATRAGASMSAQTRADVTGYTYTVEEVPDAPDPKPDPTSTTERLVGLLRDRHARGLAKYGTTLDREDLTPQQWAHHVEIPRDRVKELEEMVETLRKKLNETLTDNDDIHRDLALAIEIGDAMREAMRHGAWGHDGEGHLASVSAGSWDRFKTSLAKAPSVPVGASDAPGEGGDSDRRRLEALERWLMGNTYRMVYFSSRGVIVAGSDSIGDDDMEAPTLPALADKLAEKEAKP